MPGQLTGDINVLFFGAAAAAAGVREAKVMASDETSVAALLGELRNSFPALRQIKLLSAVNQEFASPDVTVNAGDEFAVFTAVSGG